VADPSGVVFLFDENSPWRLVRSLRELGQEALHVNDVNRRTIFNCTEAWLRRAPDEVVLRHAGERGWIMVGRTARSCTSRWSARC
jgi:predicted nuclease of predicted toxin-antitoxin system